MRATRRTAQRPLRVVLAWAALLVSGAPAGADAVSPAGWLPSDLRTELGPTAARALQQLLATAVEARAPVSRQACLDALLAAAELRPSVAELGCDTVVWLVAPVRDRVLTEPAAYRNLAARLRDAAPGRALTWRDAVDMRTGAVLRLAGATTTAANDNPAGRLWRALWLLDSADADAARATVAAGLPAMCSRACALRALELVVRGRLALVAGDTDAALAQATRAAAQLDGAMRRAPASVVAVAAPLAMLFADLDNIAPALRELARADQLAATCAPGGDALRRHLGAVRYAVLVRANENAAAADQLEQLESAHGRALRAYAVTRARFETPRASAGQGPATTERPLPAPPP